MKEMLDTQQASAYLRIAKQTLAKWRVYGQGPTWAKWGRSVYYAREELDRFIDAHTRRSTSDPGTTGNAR